MPILLFVRLTLLLLLLRCFHYWMSNKPLPVLPLQKISRKAAPQKISRKPAPQLCHSVIMSGLDDSTIPLPLRPSKPPGNEDGEESTFPYSPSSYGGPEVANPSSTELSMYDGELITHRDHGMQHSKEQLYELLANKQIPLEESESMLRGLAKRLGNDEVRATFVNGIQIKEVDDEAHEPVIGMTFMAGADLPQVTQMEEIGMRRKDPEQRDATWRVNTAGTLLTTFDVDKELSITQADNTASVVKRSRERRRISNGSRRSDTSPTRALATRHRDSRGDRTVTIDSKNVQIVNDLSKGTWDLEATLIEVDGLSLISLIVNYRHLIHRGGPQMTFADTVRCTLSTDRDFV